MADESDLAEIERNNLELVGLNTVRRKIQQMDPGIPGECVRCGENMPRLVKGVCTFCRDKFKLP